MDLGTQLVHGLDEKPYHCIIVDFEEAILAHSNGIGQDLIELLCHETHLSPLICSHQIAVAMQLVEALNGRTSESLNRSLFSHIGQTDQING